MVLIFFPKFKGCSNILGQFFGGILIFILVEVYRLFKDRDNCELLVCEI